MKLLLSLITLVIFNFCFAQDTAYYNAVRFGKPVGKQLSWKKGNTEFYYYYEFNDRGRGPSITSHITTNDKGNIIGQYITGVDYYKTKVDEKFEVKNGKASWKNKFENKTVPYKGEVYSNINGTPAENELILKLLKQSPTKKVSILPSGNLEFKVVKETTVTDDNNNKLSIQLIGFSGLGGPPFYTWYDVNGNFFGSLSDWMSIIKKSFEKNIEELLATQKIYEKKFFTDLSAAGTEEYPQGIAIKNVTVFNAAEGSTFINGTVLIKNNLIEKVGGSSFIKIPAGYKVIDGTNKFLMPG
ncbi:MAG: hypothetical protein HYR66_06410, partial [Sphingobacteriales bacterium]|nr:hypothetical protein [Sphingobacteriales bacterium]